MLKLHKFGEITTFSVQYSTSPFIFQVPNIQFRIKLTLVARRKYKRIIIIKQSTKTLQFLYLIVLNKILSDIVTEMWRHALGTGNRHHFLQFPFYKTYTSMISFLKLISLNNYRSTSFQNHDIYTKYSIP